MGTAVENSLWTPPPPCSRPGKLREYRTNDDLISLSYKGSGFRLEFQLANASPGIARRTGGTKPLLLAEGFGWLTHRKRFPVARIYVSSAQMIE